MVGREASALSNRCGGFLWSAAGLHIGGVMVVYGKLCRLSIIDVPLELREEVRIFRVVRIRRRACVDWSSNCAVAIAYEICPAGACAQKDQRAAYPEHPLH